MSYAEFLETKRRTVLPAGFTVKPSDVHPMLFDFQRDITVWAARKGRAAVLLDAGLGKTFVQLEWARLSGQRTLILAPLSVARQTVREGRKISLDVHYVRGQHEVTGDGQLWITNYEMLDAFDPAAFGAVVLDECFVAGTPIDTPAGPVPIENLGAGDMIFSAAGVDRVMAIKQQHLSRIVRLRTTDGRQILCSENHPFFSIRGIIAASMLKKGDYLYATREAVRVVRSHFRGIPVSEEQAVLQSILLREMENAPTRDPSEGSQSRGCRETRSKEARVVPIRKLQGSEGNRAHSGSEPYVQPGEQGKGICHVATDEAQTQAAGGQRAGDSHGTGASVEPVGGGVVSGVCHIPRAAQAGISDVLQGRYREPVIDAGYRGGWGEPSSDGEEGTGCEEGCGALGAWVESAEVFQCGDPEFRALGGRAGKIAFYDIQVEKHPSYSTNGLLVHNSSILKSLTGKTRGLLIERFGDTPYRLCCTATPAPNDYTELGNHAEFLGICTTQEMLATYFVNANRQQVMQIGDQLVERKGRNDGGQEWRLKHHAEDAFFRWLASWAITMVRPSDLGYDDNGFILPPLTVKPVYFDAEYQPPDRLFFMGLSGITDRVAVRRRVMERRLDTLVKLVQHSPDDQWIVWVGLNEESEAVAEALPYSVEVKGSETPECKARAFEEFQDGLHRVLVTKTRIGGLGLNMQCSHRQAFFGLSDSWEAYYQAIRRQWRFGQTRPVDVYLVLADVEEEIHQNILRKDALASRLRAKLIGAVRDHERSELGLATERLEQAYEVRDYEGAGWKLLLGDSCERLAEIESESTDLGVHSPPFADLFTYSASDRDLGNCKNWGEFFEHYAFIIREMLRVTKPGRLTCVHTSDIPAMQSRDGYIGLRDFPGEVIRAYEKEGWIFTGRAFVQKNPQALVDGTLVLTPGGSVAIERLRPGDEVIGSDGQPTLVWDVPYRGIQLLYGVIFSNGTRVLCSPDHLWKVRRIRLSGPEDEWHVMRTVDIYNETTNVMRIQYDVPALEATPNGLTSITRRILSILPTDSAAPCTCIAVEAPDGLYATQGHILTHNSQAIRVKSKALLFVQLRKDSSDSRPALVDQVLIFKKPGDNAVPVRPVDNGELDNETWIEWANGIWLGISESDTLSYHDARAAEDEKHICPLQLGTIERCIRLYSNPGELVLSPFAGIGSEGYVAVKLGRRFIGCELKPSYAATAAKNLRDAEVRNATADLWSTLEESV